MNAELELLNEVWTKVWLEQDAGTVEKLMASTYVYIAPNGQVLDRGTILGIIRSPEYRLINGARTEVKITPLSDDSVAVISRWQGEGSYQGQPFQDDHHCTSVFVRHQGRWQIALEHCTAISQPATHANA